MLYDEMIRDRIVVDIRDAKLSEKLQLDAELTLSKAVTQVRQAEAVKLQQPLVRGGTHEAAAVGGVSYKGKDYSSVVPGDTGRSTSKKSLVTALKESHVQDVEKAQAMSIITAHQGMPFVVSVTKKDTTKLCVEQASLEKYMYNG